jgi:aspartyl-tRNA(Asn)/glutamyl-tRNA(Gln) amidotransferase subunit B
VSYEAVIGLEVHVQLRTETKIFCRCPHRFGAEPNTLVCPVCLGYPGTLPVLNRRAVDLAVRLALALGARVHRRSEFDRKSYFYPDLPKGYQITQKRRPLATGGRLPLTRHPREIALERLHLEEDAGKLLHEAPGGRPLPGYTLVDFNRCGAPLVEIVSRPELSTPEEARDFLQSLHRVLLFTGTSDGSMEEGSLRCDANVSLHRPGDPELGTRTEIKNVSSFRHLARALEHEIERQTEVLDRGDRVERETRGLDADAGGAGATRTLRGKEDSPDYRYLPEPDLPPLVLSEERIEALRRDLPELPWELEERLASSYGVSVQVARILGQNPELARYFERALGEEGVSEPSRGRTMARWVSNELLGELRRRGVGLEDAPPPGHLGALVDLVDSGRISRRAGKRVLAEMWDTGEEPSGVVERLGLVQIEDREALEAWIRELLDEHPRKADRIRGGETRLLDFFVGRVMQRSGGRAAPRRVRELLIETLTAPAETSVG